MNILFNILIIIFTISIVIINCIALQPSGYYISIQQYEYQGDCSSVDSTSGSSYYVEKCNSQELVGGYLIKQNTCLLFNGQTSIFLLVENNGTVLQSIYGDTDESCSGPIVSSRYTDLDFCFYTCENYYGLTYQMSLIQDIEVPSSTLIRVQYEGACNGEFKHSSILINYVVLNRCNIRYSVDSVSSITTCNSTSTTSTAYNDSQCNTPIESQINQLVNECGISNYYPNILDICNI